jgi:hypothetical protein
MQQIFIELYNYRPAWAKCPESERTDFEENSRSGQRSEVRRR